MLSVIAVCCNFSFQQQINFYFHANSMNQDQTAQRSSLILVTLFALETSKIWQQMTKKVLTLPASGIFCRLLMIFANSLDPDHARQNFGPDLDPNCLTLW